MKLHENKNLFLDAIIATSQKLEIEPIYVEKDYWIIFEEFSYYMIEEARRRRIDNIFEVEGHVYAFDSTTINLCLSVFEWAKFRKHKYPQELRKVIVLDPDDGTRYIFLTNNTEASPLLISEFYRNRWSVELFFKWVKKHLRIKRFWGTSENAVRIQIYCAIITYCLAAIVQHDMKLGRSIYEVLQILGISLTDKTHLCDLFDKSNFKNVNVLSGSSEPNLFSFSE